MERWPGAHVIALLGPVCSSCCQTEDVFRGPVLLAATGWPEHITRLLTWDCHSEPFSWLSCWDSKAVLGQRGDTRPWPGFDFATWQAPFFAQWGPTSTSIWGHQKNSRTTHVECMLCTDRAWDPIGVQGPLAAMFWWSARWPPMVFPVWTVSVQGVCHMVIELLVPDQISHSCPPCLSFVFWKIQIFSCLSRN
jgi:hypothetical protein